MCSQIANDSGESVQRHAAWLLTGDEKYGVGGPVLSLARQLRTKGWQTHFFLITGGALADECRDRGFRTTIFDEAAPRLDQRSRMHSLPRYFLQQRQFIRRIAERLAEGLHECKAEHLGMRWPFHVAVAGKAAQLAGVPSYWMMPNIVSGRWPFALDRRWYRHLCRRYQITPLANSRYTAATLGPNVGTQVLYLASDENRFNPDTVQSCSRSDLSIPDQAIVFGIFARLDFDKGQLLLWRAIVKQIQEGRDIHLLVIGGPDDGPTALAMRQLASSTGTTDRLHLIGWTSEPERYYTAVDVAVNARISPEPFGLSVIEAMLMGKPVLVHALGGPAETVINGVTGWHVPDANLECFRHAIERAIEERARWRAMGYAALQHARGEFSVARFTDNYLRIIAQNNTK
jgi:glycosyltransferase involved in cell wall biosynthesis